MRDLIWQRLSWRKRLAFRTASLIPSRWRFPIFGLPATGKTVPEGIGTQSPANLFQLSQGTACHHGAHLDVDQRIVPSLSPGANGPIEERFALRQQFFPKVKKVKGTVASLALDGDINYFHWLVENLPRWRFLQRHQEDLSATYVCQKHPFHREALRLLGMKPEFIHDSSSVGYLRADTLLIPRYVRRQEPWILPWLRDHFLPKPGDLNASAKPSRIYISRRAATSRGVANEIDLLNLLGEFGFVPVVLEELPWMEQITLFQQARAIVGAHGAGLTNLLFCEEKALAVELTPEGLQGPFYEEIGIARLLDYHTLRCVSAGQGDLHSQPITVDLPALRTLLKSRLI